jgi:hypothetical protein
MLTAELSTLLNKIKPEKFSKNAPHLYISVPENSEDGHFRMWEAIELDLAKDPDEAKRFRLVWNAVLAALPPDEVLAMLQSKISI